MQSERLMSDSDYSGTDTASFLFLSLVPCYLLFTENAEGYHYQSPNHPTSHGLVIAYRHIINFTSVSGIRGKTKFYCFINRRSIIHHCALQSINKVLEEKVGFP